jgi:hypothetical protein
MRKNRTALISKGWYDLSEGWKTTSLKQFDRPDKVPIPEGKRLRIGSDWELQMPGKPCHDIFPLQPPRQMMRENFQDRNRGFLILRRRDPMLEKPRTRFPDFLEEIGGDSVSGFRFPRRTFQDGLGSCVSSRGEIVGSSSVYSNLSGQDRSHCSSIFATAMSSQLSSRCSTVRTSTHSSYTVESG